MVGDHLTRRLKQATIQIHLKKYLIGDAGLRQTIGVDANELETIGLVRCEGDTLIPSLAPGTVLVPIDEQIANGIRAMSREDAERLRLLLGPPVCRLYQQVCNRLGGETWPELDQESGSGAGRQQPRRGRNSGRDN